MSTKRSRSGFTLPEVLVTVTVVAVLAAVVVPAVTQFAGKGDSPTAVQDLGHLRDAVAAYVSDTHQYPTNLKYLVTTSGVTGWHGPYTQANIDASTGAFTPAGITVVFTGALTQNSTSHYLEATLDDATTTCPNL